MSHRNTPEPNIFERPYRDPKGWKPAPPKAPPRFLSPEAEARAKAKAEAKGKQDRAKALGRAIRRG